MEFISYKGEKCNLRALKQEDASVSILWRNNPEIREKVMGYPYPVSAEMERKWYDNALNHTNKNALYFAIDNAETNQFIGIVMLTKIDWIARTAVLGNYDWRAKYARKRYWHRGGYVNIKSCF